MSFSDTSTKNNASHTSKQINVSENMKEHLPNIAGKPIAAIEVAPHDNSVTSLGVYQEKEQPKGFSIEYDPSSEKPELIQIEITTSKISGGYLYLLQVGNKTGQALSVEVSVL